MLQDGIPQEIFAMPTDDIIARTHLMENDIRVMKSEIMRLQHEQTTMNEQLQDNLEKIKLNKQLPYLVANVVELLDVAPEDDNDGDGNIDDGAMIQDGSNVDLDSQRRGKCAVVKTSTRTV